MKYSYYNTCCNYGDYNLLYNSYSNSYILLTNYLIGLYNKNAKNVDSLEIINSSLYHTLKSNGFIVDENCDEFKLYLHNRFRRRFSTNTYHIIINTTLNCNLSCWYCYETHISQSKISEKLIASFKKHLELKYYIEPFSELNISFFGGEPLLQTKKVIDIIKFSQQFSTQNNINLSFSITTNGTTISSDLLNILGNSKVSFQITLDGNREKHDAIRHIKINKFGTYDIILLNIKKIQDRLKNFDINIRLNYDQETLVSLDDILNDFKFLDNRRVTFSLHKVWQVNKDEINQADIIETIEAIFEKGYLVDFFSLSRRDYVCYADNMNYILLNYDGNLFKCSARDFTIENSVGILNDDGTMYFNMLTISDRLLLDIPIDCRTCKLLPSCQGICSQSILENDSICRIKTFGLSFDDFIAYNFKRTVLKEKLLSNKTNN